MYKFQFKLFTLLFFILCNGNVFAHANDLGGGFFGFGSNAVGVGSETQKDVLHERQAKKTAALSKEKKAEIAQNEHRKELNQLDTGNQNLVSKKNRMTPEERRALRRQIHDVGNEVYVSPK